MSYLLNIKCTDTPSASDEQAAAEAVRDQFAYFNKPEYQFFFYDDGYTDWRHQGNYHFETTVEESDDQTPLSTLHRIVEGDLERAVKALSPSSIGNGMVRYEDVKDKEGFRDLKLPA